MEIFLIGSLCCKFMRFILAQMNYGTLTLADLLEHFFVLSELSLLLLCETLLVTRIALERERIKWILWVLLVVNIVVTILPVGEWLLIRGLTKDWFMFILMNFELLLLRFNLIFLIWALSSRPSFHSMRIDNFSFFL